MKWSRMVRYGATALLVAGACAVGAPRGIAQGGPGGFQMPPEMRAKIAAWQKWRDQHKNLSNLQMMLYQVQEVDKDPATKLTKPQAGKMLAILKTWRSKPTMSDDQAKQVSKSIGGMLTDRQLKKMSTVQPPWARRGGGGGGFGGGRPGGGRPGGPPGGFTFPDPPKNGYNPLNPDTLPFERMRPMAKKSLDDFTAQLQAQARG